MDSMTYYNCVRLHITSPIYRHTDWLVDMCMYKHVRYVDRQGGLHVPVPICLICRQTGWFTYTNVFYMYADRVAYMFMYQSVQKQTYKLVHIYVYKRAQFADRQTLIFACTCTNVSSMQTERFVSYTCAMCPICKKTGLFTCTNVSNMQAERVVIDMYMY